jgi:hypothetical protein
MESAELEKEIRHGKDLFSEMVRITSDFLARFDELALAEIHDFKRKRQQLQDTLIKFCAELRGQFSEEEKNLPLVVTKQLEEFRIFQEVFVGLIMEKDAEIISRATGSLERMKKEMTVITQGKKALRGYNRKRCIAPHSLNETA